MLYDFGNASFPAKPVEEGELFATLRKDMKIECKDNVASFEKVEGKDPNFLYAYLKCFITRGARINCRKNHIAFRLRVINAFTGEPHGTFFCLEIELFL